MHKDRVTYSLIDEVIVELDKKHEKKKAIERKRKRRKCRELVQNDLDQSTVFIRNGPEDSCEVESKVKNGDGLAICN